MWIFTKHGFYSQFPAAVGGEGNGDAPGVLGASLIH